VAAAAEREKNRIVTTFFFFFFFLLHLLFNFYEELRGVVFLNRAKGNVIFRGIETTNRRRCKR
jgi:hypothetical protein